MKDSCFLGDIEISTGMEVQSGMEAMDTVGWIFLSLMHTHERYLYLTLIKDVCYLGDTEASTSMEVQSGVEAMDISGVDFSISNSHS